MHKERHALLAVNLTSVCRAILAATIALWSISNNQPADAGGDDISAEDAIPSRTLPASVAEHRMAGEPSETANSGSQAEPLPKVIGGETARPFQFPWQVALLRSAAAPDQPYQGFFCGGTRIRSNWVLTAAHCTYAELDLPNGPPVELLPQDIDIYAGSVNFQGGQRFKVRRIVRYGYDFVNNDNDIALLELEVAGDAPSPVVALADTAGSTAYVVGWGSTAQGVVAMKNRYAAAELQYAQVAFKEQWLCNKYYVDEFRSVARQRLKTKRYSDRAIDKYVNAEYPSGSQLLTDRMLCAGTDSGARDACFGDSGGPLLVAKGKDGYAQVGVVSWGPDGRLRANQSLRRLHQSNAFLDWISKTVGP